MKLAILGFPYFLKGFNGYMGFIGLVGISIITFAVSNLINKVKIQYRTMFGQKQFQENFKIIIYK